jgi:hypothetical protein
MVEGRAMFPGFYKGTLERIVIHTNLLWIILHGSSRVSRCLMSI